MTTPEPRCERQTAAAINQQAALLTRCDKPAPHTINVTVAPAVEGQPQLVFSLRVCDGCVQQLTGWH